MKNRVFKIIMVLVIILTMTMTNFVFVGSSLISYAVDGIATNHQNVEFKAYFKNEEGEEVATLETKPNEEETFLYLRVNVKKEGYFNGEITLDESNFTLKETDSSYVSKIENNTIYLNQINVGTTEEIKVKIEPNVEEYFTIGLLSMDSEISIKGIYRDSTQKDINIKSSRNVKLELTENNTSSDVLNQMQLITNKIVEIDGQEKRMIQFSYNLGLIENNYPIKEISSKITIPSIDGKQAEVDKNVYFNNMTYYNYKYDGNTIEFTLTNEPTTEGKVMWKEEGSENIIITCFYDKEVEIENTVLNAQEKITLYDDKEIETVNEVTIGAEELDSIIEIDTSNSEEMIYKGKINAGIDRQYKSTTQVKINSISIVKDIIISEDSSKYIVNGNEQEANVTYSNTTISKEQFDKLFGENGQITIYDQNSEVIKTITNETKADQDGNIIIDYNGKEVTKLSIQTSNPVEEGTLEFNHIKTIKASENAIKEATELKNNIEVGYNGIITDSKETAIKLENTTTKASLNINKESLSTVIANNVEIRTVLVSDDEKYDLYKNPQITIELPEEVENITINSIDLLYENELKIKDYTVDGRKIKISLEGEQTQYKEETVDGATIVVNVTINVNRKSSTSDKNIQMTCSNENGENVTTSKTIKIVAPTDVTTVTTIEQLDIEEINQDETKEIMLQRGTEEQEITTQIEIINNKENTIEDIKVLGTFPTGDDENSIGISVTSEIDAPNATVYYSENENATEDLSDSENEWSTEITDPASVKKYLITTDAVESQDSIIATYNAVIPANLEYNETASQDYQVTYTDSVNNLETTVKSTQVDMTTGVGPQLKATLTAMVGTDELKDGDQVKAGEVIKYNIEVSNIGTETATDITLSSPIPEGTTLVKEKEEFEYTGASYYVEAGKDDCKENISQLEAGETIVRQYEVRVDSDIKDGTITTNKATVEFDDVKTLSNEFKTTLKSGDIRVTLKRITTNGIELIQDDVIQYYALVENISSELKENVKLKTNFSNEVEVLEAHLIEGAVDEELTNEDDLTSEDIEYNSEIDLGDFEQGQMKILYFAISPKTSGTLEISMIAEQGKNEYRSNLWKDQIASRKVEISISSNQQKYVKNGDTIEYDITVNNKGTVGLQGVMITDQIDSNLELISVQSDGEELELPEDVEVVVEMDIDSGEEKTVKIVTTVRDIEDNEEGIIVTNKAIANYMGEDIATTEEITHIIEPNEDTSDNENIDDENNNEGDNENNSENSNDENNGNEDNNENQTDVSKGTRMISGIAWYDENGNGKKDNDENILNGVTVNLLNAETNQLVKDKSGNTLSATTSENGTYILSNIENGKYIVIFDYNSTEYTLTKYKVDGADESINSNAIINEISIEGTNKTVAATDIIQINNENIADINIGLVKLQNFDLKLEKFVSKILIQNSAGTTVREYDDSTLAKVELDSKLINNTTVIIEYKIKITNAGEVEGYVKKVADYMPSDLKFSSELNKDWYQSGSNLYNVSLANDKIAAGETKELTLTLTKTMTENNTGLINNMAEIAEAYNELGLSDSNSTPGNKVKDENDMGSADVMISIKTGEVIVYTTIIILVIAILGGVTIPLVNKKRKAKQEKPRHKFDKI